MRLAVALLLLVAGVHYGYDFIALGYDDHAIASRAWFYMLRGVEGVVLFAIIAGLVRSRAVVAVCVLGMFEEGMTTACRASKPIGKLMGYEPFSGLCGREWYFVGLAALGLIALGLVYELGRNKRGTTRT